MIPQFRIWPIAWLVVALLVIAFSSFTGGNISLLAGWLLLLVWAPLGIMIPQFRIWPIVWLVVALIVIAFSAFTGGDTSLLAGWLFLVWTAPFGMIWEFILYDYVHMLKWLPLTTIQIMGELLSVGAAYIFWFVLIPWIRTARKKR